MGFYGVRGYFCSELGSVIKSDGYDFLFGFLTTEDTHVNTGTDTVRSVKEIGHDAYYDDYGN